MKRVHPSLPYILIAAGVQVAIALWVPVNHTLIDRTYFRLDLMQGFEPRALIGTLSHRLDLDETQFLIFTQAALFIWILNVAFLIATEERIPDPPDWKKLGLLFLFTFSTLPFITNAASGYVDIFAAATLAFSVWLLSPPERSSPTALAAALLLMCVASLIHEKSLFECLILLLWIAFTQTRKRAVGVIAAYAVFFAGYLYLTAGKIAGNSKFTSTDYLHFLEQPHQIVIHSVNVFGIVFGGGLLWALYVWFSIVFLREARGEGKLFARLSLVGGMLALCFAPLLVAWDTNRLVAAVWLPTLLLGRTLDFPLGRGGERRNQATLFGACLLQALIPPVFIWLHHAVALNCYGAFAVKQIERSQAPDLARWPTALTLQLATDRPDISDLYGCAPVHFLRP